MSMLRSAGRRLLDPEPHNSADRSFQTEMRSSRSITTSPPPWLINSDSRKIVGLVESPVRIRSSSLIVWSSSLVDCSSAFIVSSSSFVDWSSSLVVSSSSIVDWSSSLVVSSSSLVDWSSS